MLDSLVAAMAVLLLFGGVVWLLRRAGPAIPWRPGSGSLARSPRLLGERERLLLGPQHRLHVIEMDGGRLLLATHPGGVTVVAPWEATTEAPMGRTGASA